MGKPNAIQPIYLQGLGSRIQTGVTDVKRQGQKSLGKPKVTICLQSSGQLVITQNNY